MLSLRKRTAQCMLQLTLVSLCSAAFANDSKISISETRKAAVLDQILAKYDARIRPTGVNGTDGPVVASVCLYLRTTPNIDVVKQEYTVQITFRERWVDERLKFDDKGDKLKYLAMTSTERIWMPDVFFSNEKEIRFHEAMKPNAIIRIFPTGVITYSVRISLTLDCPMNLELYPFDRQDCSLRMMSYAYTTNDLVLLWKEVDALEISRRIQLQGFTLIGHSADYCSTKLFTTGEYSCLDAIFSFKRDLMPSLIRIYIPNCVLVLAAFVSFWLDSESVAARVFLGTSTLLAMVFQISYGTTSLPAVSYIKAIDIWMGVCLIFIFGTLLEFATLNYTSRYDVEDQCEQAGGIPLLLNDESKESKKTWMFHYKHFLAWLSKFPRSKKIDVVSRIVFPIAFVLFNLAYWITYLTPNES